MTIARRTVPSIDALQTFVCAAQHGSFTQAAAELHLTQSAVSRKIRQLELQLGMALFERARQRVALSSLGSRFLIDARTLLRQAEEVMLRTMASASADASLSIATLPTFGNRWLVPRLPRFLQRQPRTALNIASRTEPFDFADEPYDLAIHFGQPIWAHAHCRPLCREIVVPIIRSDLAARSEVKSATDVGRLTQLHLTTRPRAWEQWSRTHDAHLREPHSGHRFDQFSTIIEAVIAGIGVALVPRFAVEPELANGTLLALNEYPLASEGGYFAVVPDAKTDSPVINAFVDWLQAEMPPQ